MQGRRATVGVAIAGGFDGDDLRERPLEQRREALARLVAKRRSDGIVYSEALQDEGALVYMKACALGLEGIVSKRAGRQRQIFYADLRKERQRQATHRHVATSATRQAHHDIRGGGVV
jgi:hypothetical protein